MTVFLIKTLFNIALITAVYLIGNSILVLFKTQKQGRLYNYFFSLLTGLLVCVVCYAIYKTSFRTLFIAAIPIVLWSLRMKPVPTEKLSFSDVVKWLPVFFLMAFVMMFTVEFFFFYKYMGITKAGIYLPEIHNDEVFYANIAAHINDTGYENYNLNTAFNSVNLYHYTESWLTALINALNPGSYLVTFIFHSLPLIFVIVWFGFVALAASLMQNKSIAFCVLISALCFFIAPLGMLVKPFSSILRGDVYSLIFSNYYKLSIIYMFIVGIFLSRNSTNNMFFLSLMLMLFYPTLLPATLGSFFMFIIYLLYRDRKLPEKYTWLVAAVTGACVIMGVILATHAAPPTGLPAISLYDLYIVDAVFFIRSIINIFGSSILKIIITCLPYLVLGYFLFRKMEKPMKYIMMGILIMLLNGLIAWSLFLQIPDSVQFWNNIYCTAVNTAIFTLLVLSLTDERLWIKIFGGALIVMNVIFHNPVQTENHLATRGELALIEKVSSAPHASFAYLRHPDEFTTVFLKNTTFAVPANYISFYVNTYTPSCINGKEVSLNGFWETYFFNNTPFGRFAQKRDVPQDQLQSEFIQYKNINFVIATEKAVIPSFLASMTDTILVDDYNKIKCIVLK